MRANEILAKQNNASLAKMNKLLGFGRQSRSDLVKAMGNEEIFERIVEMIIEPIDLEDFFILISNPFDSIHSSELNDPNLLESLGVIYRKNKIDNFQINLDIAIASAQQTPFEFGFASTLIARLDHKSLHTVRKGLGVGVRVNFVDQVLAIAENTLERSLIMRNIALLNQNERDELNVAIKAGVLPDDIQTIGIDAELPVVELAPGRLGKKGFVFIVSQPNILEKRPVVAFQLLDRLPQILEEVPLSKSHSRSYHQDTIPKRSYTRSSPQNKRRKSKPKIPVKTVKTSHGFLAVMPGISESEVKVAQVLSRVANIQNASAILDLEKSELRKEVLENNYLKPDIIDTVGETQIILREGVDPDIWIEKCTFRLQLK